MIWKTCFRKMWICPTLSDKSYYAYCGLYSIVTRCDNYQNMVSAIKWYMLMAAFPSLYVLKMLGDDGRILTIASCLT